MSNKTNKLILTCASIVFLSFFGAIAHAQQDFSNVIKDIEFHVSEVNTLIHELAIVTTPAQALEIEKSQKNKITLFLQHVKKIDSHGSEMGNAVKAGGNLHPNIALARKYKEELINVGYPKLSAEMLRVEKIHPPLKQIFDQLRNMHN
jgi:hypothetical protein